MESSERIARLRALQALCAVYWRQGNVIQMLRDAETWRISLDGAMTLLDVIPTVPRRKIISTFMWLHRPLTARVKGGGDDGVNSSNGGTDGTRSSKVPPPAS
jgi:hypothetical protein